MSTQVAAARQPFAPLNNSRLQNLTSLKNRQNALTTLTSPTKRKAPVTNFSAGSEDSENIDPSLFLSPKRSKGADGSAKDTYFKPTNFFLTKAPPSPNEFSSVTSTPNPALSPRRPILTPRSPAPRLNTKISKSAPLSAPAGRSPTRKRAGLLNRRKTASPFTRIDPPKFGGGIAGGLGFSIDAALEGTIPGYKRPLASSTTSNLKAETLPLPELHRPESKNSWFFDIHEDTAEEEATNLMEHSTCTLDISSDEESAARAKDERGKENVPPMDDISQTRTQLSSSASMESSISDIKARIRASRQKREADENAIEIDRSPLGDLAAEDFYAEGCDGTSVFLIPSDSESVITSPEPVEQEPEQQQEQEYQQEQQPEHTFDLSAEAKGKGKEIEEVDIDIDALMQKDAFLVAPKAALLEPLEKAEEGFALWESGSVHDDE